jgi:hypothetical protein
LVRFQLTEAAVDGALDAAFVTGEAGEGVGGHAIGVEGAGQAVAFVVRGGDGRRRSALECGALFLPGVGSLSVGVFFGDLLEAVAVEAGFHGEGAVETPVRGGEAQDQHFFGVADGLEAVVEVVEENEEIFGVFVEQDVFVGAQAVQETIAAGGSLSGGGAGAGGFFRILTVGVDLGLGRGAGFVGWVHVRPHLEARVRAWRRPGTFRACG